MGIRQIVQIHTICRRPDSKGIFKMHNFEEEFCELRDRFIENKFSRMNPMQQEAIYSTEGPVLVLAGAGSGKTTVIIGRILNMIMFGCAHGSKRIQGTITENDVQEMRAVMNDGVAPSQHLVRLLQVDPVAPEHIMAVTFTNKAAGELKTRLSQKLGEETGSKVFATTFHSACAKLLRRYASYGHFKKDFAIYDEKDTLSVLREVYKEKNLKEKDLAKEEVMQRISHWKDKLFTPEKARKSTTSAQYVLIADIYESYQKKLENADAMDFDDLIMNMVLVLQNNPEVQKELQNRFQYIMVDEYQDTSVAQHMLVSLLVPPSNNICVVGDDDQSIYSFRGATVDNILHFESEYPNVKSIRLEENYRSTGNILDLANNVIAHNARRLGKNLWTKADVGNKIEFEVCKTDYEEADRIVRAINENVFSGKRYKDHVVLFRNASISRVIERALGRAKIPYTIVGGIRFFDRAEVKDIMSYLSIVANPDDDLRLKRIINVPARKIGPTTVDRIAAIAKQNGTSMMDVIRNVEAYPQLGNAAVCALKAFAEMYKDMCVNVSANDIAALTEYVIKRSGYAKMLKEKGTDAVDTMKNVMQVVTAASEYEDSADEPSLTGFLAETALLSSTDKWNKNENTVKLMTIHASKGLEFPIVFLIGLDTGIFPSPMRSTEYEEEEERRLFYVAITRAKERLYLFSCKQRHTFGAKPENHRESSFVHELDDTLLDYNSASDVFHEDVPSFWYANATF